MENMASDQFSLRVLTPSRELISALVTEVLLPAHDGEVGVLANHGNFIGVLGTGVLKLVTKGDDYWFMVSAGIFEVRHAQVTVLADQGEAMSDINIDAARAKVAELEPVLSEKSSYDGDFELLKIEFERAKARLEAHRRTELLN